MTAFDLRPLNLGEFSTGRLRFTAGISFCL